MLKKVLTIGWLAVVAMAGEYLQLANGKTVLLKEDGTYEEVTIVQKGDQTIALKKDGTYEVVKHLERAKPVATPPATTDRAHAPQPSVDPLAREYARKLQGHWESLDGKLSYDFEGDRVIMQEGKKRRSDRFTIEKIDPNDREFLLNIGEGEKIGIFSFGGTYRKMRFSPDFSHLTDYSASIPTSLTKR